MASLTRRQAVKGMVVGSAGVVLQERFGGRRKWNTSVGSWCSICMSTPIMDYGAAAASYVDAFRNQDNAIVMLRRSSTWNVNRLKGSKA